MLKHPIREHPQSTPVAGEAALKRFYRLIRDCLPLLLAMARNPSRSKRQHQQRKQDHRQPDPKG